MLKLAGVCLILAGTIGLGRYLASYLNMRFGQLVGCREIFTQMDSGRKYLRLPYAELLRRTAKGKEELLSGILLEIADEMEQNREADVGALWEAALHKRKQQILLDEEERDLMLSLARSLALEGDHEQTAKIYLIQLEEKILKAMEEKKEKQKLYGAVSVLGGLFVVILLL